MAVAQAITEIPDSEDEPLTSSPQPVLETESLNTPSNQQNKTINHIAYQDTDNACEFSRELSEQEAADCSNHDTPLPLRESRSAKPSHCGYIDDSSQFDAISKVKKHVNESDVHVTNPPKSFVSNPSINPNLHVLDEDDTEKDRPQSQFIEPPRGTVEQTVAPRSKTPQEVTIDELKSQKRALISSLATFESVQELIAENEASDFASRISAGEPSDSDVMTAANTIVGRHIKLLHNYNEIKDIGQGLMGLIADSRGVRIMEVHDEFGVSAKD
ncbi:hypothetical protein DM02DRAFT_612702 [Periconia macrospinosa]|uniref:Swi5-domain-containing protein n=1 Tax=Periconia macrospinosa TaxID=97972 RepID=A0A2V1DWJ5_9PLEO|nr:hypothetical protein DM02DRAFT_612702 [Periconia macrospinosa]